MKQFLLLLFIACHSLQAAMTKQECLSCARKALDVKLFKAIHKNDMFSFNTIRDLFSGNKIPNVNKQDENGWTPLITACFNGNEAIARFLINAQANINMRTHDGRTALMLADSSNMLKLLVAEQANLDVQDNIGRTALMWLVYRSYFHNNHGETARCIQFLVAGGANISIQNGNDGSKTIEDYIQLLQYTRFRLIPFSIAIEAGKKEREYYLAQRELIEQQEQLIPVIGEIISRYTFGEVPHNLHDEPVAKETPAKSCCTIM